MAATHGLSMLVVNFKGMRMSTYQSRHQPRRQLVVTGKVLQPETYDRFYDIATDVLKLGRWPTMTLAAGTLLARAVTAKALKDDVLGRAIDVEGARQVPPGSAMNSFNRFSGRRLDGRPGQGALYVATIAAGVREITHYAMQRRRGHDGLNNPLPAELWKPGQGTDAVRQFRQQAEAGELPADPDPQNVFLYRLASNQTLADLRLPTLAALMAQLKSTPGWAARYGLAAHARFDLLTAAVADAQDYSAARGLADALADAAQRTGVAGLCAYSSRADTETGLVFEGHDDASGGLVLALFGEPGCTITSLLPLSVEERFAQRAVSQRLAALAGYALPGQLLPALRF